MESSKNASQQILLKRQSSLVLRFLISTSPTPRALCARSQRSQHRSGEARLSHQEPIPVKDVGLTDQQTIHRNAERPQRGQQHTVMLVVRTVRTRTGSQPLRARGHLPCTSRTVPGVRGSPCEHEPTGQRQSQLSLRLLSHAHPDHSLPGKRF